MPNKVSGFGGKYVGDAVQEAVAEGVTVSVPDVDDVNEGVGVPVKVALGDTVSLPLGEGVPEGVTDGVTVGEDDCVGENESVVEPEGVCDGEGGVGSAVNTTVPDAPGEASGAQLAVTAPGALLTFGAWFEGRGWPDGPTPGAAMITVPPLPLPPQREAGGADAKPPDPPFALISTMFSAAPSVAPEKELSATTIIPPLPPPPAPLVALDAPAEPLMSNLLALPVCFSVPLHTRSTVPPPAPPGAPAPPPPPLPPYSFASLRGF